MKKLLMGLLVCGFSLNALAENSAWTTVGKIQTYPRGVEAVQAISDANLNECDFRIKSVKSDGSPLALVSASAVSFSGEGRQLSFLVYTYGSSGQDPKAYPFSLTIEKTALTSFEGNSEVRKYFGKSNELQMRCK